MKRIFLIDLSNFLYKYRTTLNLKTKLDSGVEVNTSALYGLMKTLAHNDFEEVVLCLDGQPQLFKNYYPQYKGQRSKEHDGQLLVPIEEVLEMAYAYQPFANKTVHIACSPGQEADQVISSIVHGINRPFLQSLHSSSDLTTDWSLKRYASWNTDNLKLKHKTYDQIVIGTTDSDMYQLLEFKNVFISTRTNGSDSQDEVTPTSVAFCNPEQIPVYKAIVGDVSDNIPPVISNRNKKTIDMVLEVLPDLSTLNKFVTYLETNRNPQPGFPQIAQLITDVGQLKINQKITTLTYYSWPVSISPKSSDLDVLLIKYNVRLR